VSEKMDAVPLLMRRIAWDIIPCEEVADLFPKLGLVPASDEVFDMEHDESHRRIDLCGPLVNYIEVFAEITNQVIKAYMLRETEDEASGITAAYVELLVQQNLSVMRRGIYATLAQLLDTGVIVIGEDHGILGS